MQETGAARSSRPRRLGRLHHWRSDGVVWPPHCAYLSSLGLANVCYVNIIKEFHPRCLLVCSPLRIAEAVSLIVKQLAFLALDPGRMEGIVLCIYACPQQGCVVLRPSPFTFRLTASFSPSPAAFCSHGAPTNRV